MKLTLQVENDGVCVRAVDANGKMRARFYPAKEKPGLTSLRVWENVLNEAGRGIGSFDEETVQRKYRLWLGGRRRVTVKLSKDDVEALGLTEHAHTMLVGFDDDGDLTMVHAHAISGLRVNLRERGVLTVECEARIEALAKRRLIDFSALVEVTG